MYKIQPNTLFFGKVINFLPSCHSTNDIAAELIQNADVFEGTIIITDHQTAGRGQRGNTWQTQAGENLTFSLILKPKFLKANQQFWLNIAVSLGVQECLTELLGGGVKIKWSNDLYYNNQKIGGMLLENSLQGYQIGYSVIGIGLNVNQSEFPMPTATSLRQITNQWYDLETVLEKLIICLEKNYLALQNGQYETLKTRYLSTLFRYEETHYFEQNGHRFLGKITGISETGQLALEIEEETQYFDFKEITFVI